MLARDDPPTPVSSMDIPYLVNAPPCGLGFHKLEMFDFGGTFRVLGALPLKIVLDLPLLVRRRVNQG